MNFFVCTSLLIVIIAGGAINVRAKVIPNPHDKPLKTNKLLQSNEISQDKCPDHKKRINGICECANESLKTKDGYCCYRMRTRENVNNCLCPINQVYDFVKNVCKNRIEYIFDR